MLQPTFGLLNRRRDLGGRRNRVALANDASTVLHHLFQHMPRFVYVLAGHIQQLWNPRTSVLAARLVRAFVCFLIADVFREAFFGRRKGHQSR